MAQWSGGYMKVQEGYDGIMEYLKDETTDVYPYPRAVSKIDENNLNKLAKDMGIEYINMSKQSNITSKINEIKRKLQNGGTVQDTSGYTELYYIFALPLLILLVLEYINYKKKLQF